MIKHVLPHIKSHSSHDFYFFNLFYETKQSYAEVHFLLDFRYPILFKWQKQEVNFESHFNSIITKVFYQI